MTDEHTVLLIDGPIAVSIHNGTNIEILEALGRLIPLIRTAALEIHELTTNNRSKHVASPKGQVGHANI
jgi:hypothetical protein